MNFTAYCPHCEKPVTAHTLLNAKELKEALDNDKEVKVMHTVDIDHLWVLNYQEKENLRGRIASGEIALGASGGTART